MSEFFRKYKNQVFLLLAIAALIAGFLFFLPWLFLHPVPCIHKQLTGISCPLCGMTHALYEFFHFHFLKGIQYNPAVILVIAFAGSEIINRINPSTAMTRIKKISFHTLVISLAIVYGLRIIGVLN